MPAPPRFGFYPGNVSNDPNAAHYDLAKTSARLGVPGVVRVYFSGPPPVTFPGSPADVGLPVVVSFKANPADVVAGRLDTTITTFLSSVPAGREVWWSYYHEPENDIEHGAFTAAEYRAAWAHLLSVAPKRPELHPTLVLMRYDLAVPARRPIESYLVPGLEVLAWDAYLGRECAAAADCYAPAAATSARYGLRFALAETAIVPGSVAAQHRRSTVDAIVQSAIGESATFVTWFETNKSDGDWRLSRYRRAAAVWRAETHS